MKSKTTKTIGGVVAILLGSLLISLLLAYFDEGKNSLASLSNPGDRFALLLYTLLGAVIPLIIFLSWRKSGGTMQRMLVSMLGFIPYLVVLWWVA